MYDKVADNYTHPSECVPECYKAQKMCDKAVNTYPFTITFGPECYKTREIYDKVVDRCFFALVTVRPTKCVTELFPKILLC